MSLVHDSLRAFAAGAAVCCVVYAATALPAETRASINDFAFKPGPSLPRMRAAFPDHVLVELPDAKHFIQEDAPDEIAAAIIERFG